MTSSLTSALSASQENEDIYSILPPATWNCSKIHGDPESEEEQPGDEDFKIIYDDGALVIVQVSIGLYSGHINTAVKGVRPVDAWKMIYHCGLKVTSVLPTPTRGEYSLRLRDMTPTEKELVRDLSS